MNYDIVKPTKGRVTLDLSWKEAEILARAVGMVNYGNLKDKCPSLLDFITDMMEQVGRNTHEEARRYVAKVIGSQVYINDVESW